MIMKQTVQWTAEQFVRKALTKSQNPKHKEIMEIILKPPYWTKWIELLHVRCNELDLSGYVRSRASLENFIQSATLVYAQKQIDRMLAYHNANYPTDPPEPA